MNIKQAADLLGQVGIKTKATDDFIHVIPSFQDENIYKMEKRGDQWNYLFIQNERGTGKETTLKTFQSEAEASVYFLLDTLQSSFFSKYIFPLRVGGPSFTFEDLQKLYVRFLSVI
ncbi:hypothetical protein A8F94_00425 [Bacillus sp. FJAT-27225]|uniref:hypothetical protein n=1 Tax=Bacillus sp. FJAT-27225 TaxID=1743144 RepID=UPI00080C2489|nr:hypothetical protein [Bacillus sp. FJAT-27225]OCA90397.1 hypothetical protein A8F94_00425 [Bacillus sp. FJAT-27225]